jgi:hypothetical protein
MSFVLFVLLFSCFPPFVSLFYLFLVGPRNMTMSRTTFPRSYSAFETFEKMNLEEFKDFISVADYKICESKMDKNPIWYPLTFDVFVKFLYKIIFLSFMLMCVSYCLFSFIYIRFCLY